MEKGPVARQRLDEVRRQLEEQLEANDSMRMKHPDEPEKFYPSEESIHEALEKLEDLDSESLNNVIQSGVGIPLLQTLSHPNADINALTIGVMHNLLCEEPAEGEDAIYQQYFRFSIWTIENGVLNRLSSCLHKMDEENQVEEYQHVLKCLKMVATLLELSPKRAAEVIAEDTKIIEFVGNRIMPNFTVSHRVLDDNKYVSSDIIVAALENSQECQTIFLQMCGMQIVDAILEAYLTERPQHSDEKEYFSNILDACKLLLIGTKQSISKPEFHKFSINSKLLHYLRRKDDYSVQALNLIMCSFYSRPIEDASVTTRLIEDGILKYLFPLLMQQGLKASDVDEKIVIQQATLTILWLMLRTSSEAHKDRILYKLYQNNFRRLARIFELRSQYETKDLQLQELGAKEYFQMLKEGFSIVEMADKIILILSGQVGRGISQEVHKIFETGGVSLETVVQELQLHCKYLEEGQEKVFVSTLLEQSQIGKIRQVSNQ